MHLGLDSAFPIQNHSVGCSVRNLNWSVKFIAQGIIYNNLEYNILVYNFYCSICFSVLVMLLEVLATVVLVSEWPGSVHVHKDVLMCFVPFAVCQLSV